MSWLLELLKPLLGWFLNRNQANITEIADSNARAQEQLAQEREANAVQTKTANARAAAVDRVVRATNGEGDANEALREQFPGHFRD